jgi:hypothetical protein
VLRRSVIQLPAAYERKMSQRRYLKHNGGLACACRIPKNKPPVSTDYDDHVLGKTVRILAGHSHPIHSMVRPLHLIQAASWFHLPRGYVAPGIKLHQRPPPVAYMQATYWEAQRARLLLHSAACHRLSTAPATLHVNSWATSCWRTRILSHVMAGYVSKVQVWFKPYNVVFVSVRCLFH